MNTARQLSIIERIAVIGANVAAMSHAKSPRLNIIANDLSIHLEAAAREVLHDDFFPTGRAKVKEDRKLAEERATDRMRREGPALWKEFHEWTLQHDTGKRDDAWLKYFLGKIPCGQCRAGFAEILNSVLPPDWDDLPGWGYIVHNKVNEKLGKPAYNWEMFRELYNYHPR